MALIFERMLTEDTPEHVSYEAAEKGCDQPYAVFSGDSLFVSSAGRPDLLGKDADKLAAQLYDTLFGYCATGYRASIAASMLQREGFEAVRTMPGSWSAWTSAGLPVQANGGEP